MKVIIFDVDKILRKIIIHLKIMLVYFFEKFKGIDDSIYSDWWNMFRVVLVESKNIGNLLIYCI